MKVNTLISYFAIGCLVGILASCSEDEGLLSGDINPVKHSRSFIRGWSDSIAQTFKLSLYSLHDIPMKIIHAPYPGATSPEEPYYAAWKSQGTDKPVKFHLYKYPVKLQGTSFILQGLPEVSEGYPVQPAVVGGPDYLPADYIPCRIVSQNDGNKPVGLKAVTSGNKTLYFATVTSQQDAFGQDWFLVYKDGYYSIGNRTFAYDSTMSNYNYLTTNENLYIGTGEERKLGFQFQLVLPCVVEGIEYDSDNPDNSCVDSVIAVYTVPFRNTNDTYESSLNVDTVIGKVRMSSSFSNYSGILPVVQNNKFRVYKPQIVNGKVSDRLDTAQVDYSSVKTQKMQECRIKERVRILPLDSGKYEYRCHVYSVVAHYKLVLSLVYNGEKRIFRIPGIWRGDVWGGYDRRRLNLKSL